MGWSKWFSFGSDEVKEKTVTHSDGSTTTNYLHSAGGSKKNHNDVTVNRDSSGKTTYASSAGHKDKRK